MVGVWATHRRTILSTHIPVSTAHTDEVSNAPDVMPRCIAFACPAAIHYSKTGVCQGRSWKGGAIERQEQEQPHYVRTAGWTRL